MYCPNRHASIVIVMQMNRPTEEPDRKQVLINVHRVHFICGWPSQRLVAMMTQALL